ncbi:MAG TPA: DUF262 domain-containing protein [Kofleriaceae bacterium]|nr:DUF262 domain-containing protein [Kofleriaceae bacterium]
MKTGNTSFRALFGEGQRVEIPVIQRDYAQGRDDERSQEIRARFIKELASALSPGARPLDLDFVYGRWRSAERTLEPLDGQQRLTTLFLLHWYVASLDGAFDDFQAWIRHEHGGACFTYRTRPAAREFFDALVEHPAPVSTFAAKPHAVSNWITDSIWFVRGWRRDPTVRGCLTTLDAIHGSLANSKGLWPRLASITSPVIVFRLLLLENFGLSDDLYIKMNARGKALTPFEVFKAELEQFISRSFGDERHPHTPLSWRNYVSRQFDISWTNFLWRHRGESYEIDFQFMHLIRALVVIACVSQDNEAELPRRIEKLLATPEPTLKVYEELGCLGQGVVKTIVGVFDALAGHDTAPSFLGHAGYVDEAGVFRRVLLARSANHTDGLTLVDWVMFYAWCSFLLRFSSELATAPVRVAFHDWMRVVANLARNSNIDRNERLFAALKGLRQLSLRAGVDFLSQVANGALDAAGGFNQQQQREEKLKAQLILRSSNWRTVIERAETHPYFSGYIEFLLSFSGVLDRIATTGSCDWDDDEDGALRKSFADWYERTCAVFREDATSWPAMFPDCLWERALLAEGDYLLPRGRNWSFLDDKDRDASWKRLLRADTRVADHGARRDVVKRVLARVDPKNVVRSLQAIIAAGVQGEDTSPLPGFRSRLVAEPRLIEYCGLRMIRFEEETAFLLSRAQRNGYHIDLYVYDLYLGLRTRLAKVAPFDGVSYSDTRGAFPPSQLVLRAGSLGLVVTAEKHGATMQLRVQLAEPNQQLATALASWTADGEVKFSRSVSPELAEAAIVELAEHVRCTLRQPPATPTSGDPEGIAGGGPL